MTRASLAAMLCLGLAASEAHAFAPAREPAHAPSQFWAELGRPGVRRAAELVRQAALQIREANRQLPSDWQSVCRRTLALRLSSESGAAVRGRMRALGQLLTQALRRRAYLDNALMRLVRAVELDRDAPEALYLMAEVLQRWEDPGPIWECSARRRDAEAIEVLSRLREQHPQYRASQVAFELGVLHTRAQRFDAASEAYAEAIALALDEPETQVMRTNLAEMTMLSGRLEEALEHYQKAIELADGGRGYLLTLWGMAVTLDRLGEHEQAIEHIRKALASEGGRMAILRSDGVFFEPEHEINYYEGLGHEALASRSDDPRPELRAAAESFRAYLSAAGEEARFYAAGLSNLERIERLLVAETHTAPKQGVKRQGTGQAN